MIQNCTFALGIKAVAIVLAVLGRSQLIEIVGMIL